MNDLGSLSDAQLMEMYHGAPQPQPDRAPLRITVGGAKRPIGDMTDDELKAAYDASSGEELSAGGALKAIGSGLARGAIGIPSMPGDIGNHVSAGAKRIGVPESLRSAVGTAVNSLPMLKPFAGPGTDENTSAVESVTGNLNYEPKNTTEKYLKTASEFVPATLAMPGRSALNVARYGLAPGVASEAAGQATEGNALEPYARLAAGFGVGAGAAALARPGTAARALQGQLPDYVTQAHIANAERMMQAATQRGVNLTWPEALSRVTGRPVLTDMQRVLESSHQTRGQMQDFFADRPQQITNATRAELDTSIAPRPTNPSSIGHGVSREAEGVIRKIRAAISRATKPMYDASKQTLVPHQVHGVMRSDPLFVDALDAVRGNPAKNSFVYGQSDRSIAVYDAVKKELEERAKNASKLTNPNASQAVSSATGTLAGDVRNIAIATDRAATGGPSSYEAALATQARAREQYLNPILRGPLGALAKKDITTQKAINALFPAEPLANSEHEIATAVTALSNRNPSVASQLVRAHIESVFDQAATHLQGGPNQSVGAKFAAKLVGNPQQRANLEAAIRALPNGDARWLGFNRLVEIAEATGTRQAKGSLTSFNTQELRAMSSGGGIAETVKTAASPGKWWSVVNDRWSQWQLGHNLDSLARIITDPQSGRLLRQIVNAPRRSQEAGAAAARLILQSDTVDQSNRTRPESPQSR